MLVLAVDVLLRLTLLPPLQEIFSLFSYYFYDDIVVDVVIVDVKLVLGLKFKVFDSQVC